MAVGLVSTDVLNARSGGTWDYHHRTITSEAPTPSLWIPALPASAVLRAGESLMSDMSVGIPTDYEYAASNLRIVRHPAAIHTSRRLAKGSEHALFNPVP